ncbi:MAG: hypothetical protein ABI581_16830, partial [Sediminibacterium sp.]
EGKGIYVSDAVIDVQHFGNDFYVSFHAHTPDNRLYIPVETNKRESEFAKGLLTMLAKKSEGAAKLKTVERKTPETTKGDRFYETSIKMPGADCYIQHDDDNDSWGFGGYRLVAAYSPGKEADKEKLETLYKECKMQVDAALGPDGYFYFIENAHSTIYYKYDQIGLGRSGSLLWLHKDEESNKVMISIEIFS